MFKAQIVFLAALSFALLPSISRAKDKKPPAGNQPHVLMTMPLAVERDSTAHIILRGANLADATEVKAEAAGAPLSLTIKSKGKVEVPKTAVPEKVGDTQIEIELKIAADVKGNEITLTVVTPTGSESHAVRLYDAKALLPEKEPNGGFRTAQPVQCPVTVIGAVGEENDVDVFQITAKGGQKLSAEVFAARLGSALDSLLTLYDDKGQVVATNDDDQSADSLLKVTFPRDGTYFLSLTDAYSKGGPMYPYLLQIEVHIDSH